MSEPGSARQGWGGRLGRAAAEVGALVLKARGLLPLEGFNSPPTPKTQTSGQGVALGPEGGGGLPCGEALLISPESQAHSQVGVFLRTPWSVFASGICSESL